ncbi:MAG: hypothetical protein QNJ07_17260 [Woeseiaceae bacterium]|nr:hypothetical protein [Woeseiaceae bacterium]
MSRKAISLVVVLSLSITLTGCGGSDSSAPPSGSGGGGGPGGGGPVPEVVMVSLGDLVKNVVIQPMTETQFSLTYTIPNDLLTEPLTAYDTFTINLAESMPSVRITSSPVANNEDPTSFDLQKLWRQFANSDLLGKLVGVEAALAAANASVTVRVSFPGDPDVCSSETALGPFTFSGDVDTQPVSDADTASPSDAPDGINVVSSGTFEICVTVSPIDIPMDAYLTADGVEVSAIPCEETPPPDGDVLGSWSGIYSCTNFGTSDDIDQLISLTIFRNEDGSYRYTDDGGATYDGHFCGSKFRYNGGVAGSYTESGLFRLTGTGTASKQSTWNSDPAGASGGNCSDTLIKD